MPALIGARRPITLGATLGAGGVPALAWRFSNNMPVRKDSGGFWLKAS